jgi:hypothetical protein
LFGISLVVAGFVIAYSLCQSGIVFLLPVIVGDAVGIITASGTSVQILFSFFPNTPF